jgi:hypothetical protein
MTVAQTLDVVHGLVNNMRIVMDGAHSLVGLLADTLLITYRIRWKGVDGQYTRSTWYVRSEYEVAIVRAQSEF